MDSPFNWLTFSEQWRPLSPLPCLQLPTSVTTTACTIAHKPVMGGKPVDWVCATGAYQSCRLPGWEGAHCAAEPAGAFAEDSVRGAAATGADAGAAAGAAANAATASASVTSALSNPTPTLRGPAASCFATAAARAAAAADAATASGFARSVRISNDAAVATSLRATRVLLLLLSACAAAVLPPFSNAAAAADVAMASKCCSAAARSPTRAQAHDAAA